MSKSNHPDKKFTEDENMTNTRTYKPLDISILNKPRPAISTEEALRDVVPIQWREDVLSGKRKVILEEQK